ncbi:VOC family protein [Gordonia sp. LSe1-13]|uniref:VOC family protein n=1 Tax=Gordonia sesuvii TaxID=3116777 RepID=A0ABU7M963_9ACTN|nr:VOC family protein [Gordonia sp. LSe1-13]
MTERDVKALGYVRVQTTHIDRWREFALDALGFAEGSGPDADALYLRVDERSHRIAVVPGDADRVTEVGWEVADSLALARVRERLEKASVETRELTQAELDARQIVAGISFCDPTGATVEIFYGAVLDHSPVVTPHGATFVTGNQGLGHVVIPASDPGEAFDFYSEVLGFYPRGSFRLPSETGDVVRFQFMGVNPRHHSLAIAPAPGQRDPGLVHVMVEVTELDAVGEAYDRIKAAGFSLTTTLGRHTNDKMVSFYVRAPGGWDIEFGTGGLLVDQDSYSSEEITADSYWGHDWVGDAPEALVP